jgi:putative PIN family toxin of toxin-antitoxin system
MIINGEATRVVIDTNILVSRLLLRKSIPAQVVDKVLDSSKIVFSDSSFNELKEVLTRSKFDKYVSIENRLKFINILKTLAIIIEVKQNISYCRDPKDDKILEAAVNGHAQYIITGDEDLLILKSFKNTQIISPKKYLDTLSQNKDN